jgi:hypothetical protein
MYCLGQMENISRTLLALRAIRLLVGGANISKGRGKSKGLSKGYG